MREKVKQLIAEHLIERGRLKTVLRNLSISGTLTDNMQNRLLDEISKIDDSIKKLDQILKAI